jgi:hypothetical protein
MTVEHQNSVGDSPLIPCYVVFVMSGLRTSGNARPQDSQPKPAPAERECLKLPDAIAAENDSDVMGHPEIVINRCVALLFGLLPTTARQLRVNAAVNRMSERLNRKS